MDILITLAVVAAIGGTAWAVYRAGANKQAARQNIANAQGSARVNKAAATVNKLDESSVKSRLKANARQRGEIDWLLSLALVALVAFCAVVLSSCSAKRLPEPAPDTICSLEEIRLYEDEIDYISEESAKAILAVNCGIWIQCDVEKHQQFCGSE